MINSKPINKKLCICFRENASKRDVLCYIFGDGFHDFIDGLVIVASFVSSIELGIVTSLAVAFHEVPQEIGDFGVLVYGGFKKSKALFMNFATAITAVIGGIAGYYLS